MLDLDMFQLFHNWKDDNCIASRDFSEAITSDVM